MTVTDPTRQTTTSFVSQNSPPVFYNAPVPYKHWQLRSLLCSPAPNVLYYPVDARIYSLNTATKERKLITFLPFEPRCISAKYGWICTGGVDNGQIAVIKVTDKLSPSPTSAAADERRSDLIPDGPVDTFNDSPTADDKHDSGDGETEQSASRTEYLRLAELGGTIVNSITMYKPGDSKSDGDVIAIITNNDKTVRLFSLSKFRVLTTLTLPFHTNHASVSPDGKFLVVVGDSSKVYFYNLATLTSESLPNYSWKLASSPSYSGGDALISTDFSPCSKLCAIASQDGSITVFDTRLFSKNSNSPPIIRSIQSSRPQTQAGAVRCVVFSPCPWDLLVWAEHTGRITITDARVEFGSSQTIRVNVGGDNVQQTELCGDPLYHGRPATFGSTDEAELAFAAEEQEIHDEMYAAAALDEDETALPTQPLTRPREGTSVSSVGRNIYLPPLILFHEGQQTHNTGSTTHPPRRYSGADTTTPTSNTANSAATITTTATATSTTTTNDAATSPTTSRGGNNASSSITLSRLQASSNALAQLEAQYQRLIAQLTTPPPRPPTSAPSNANNDTNEPVPSLAPPTARRRYLIPSANANTDTNADNILQFESRWYRARQRQWRLEYLRRRAREGGVASGDGVDSAISSIVRSRRGDGELDITGLTWSCDGKKLYVATTSGIIEYDVAPRNVFPKFDFR
ncbi:hypothetical protein H072_4434 [Dactylellina haptotyla CBS 200.50]|uniref:DUF2415 domain-containing protein n=1 Tax=Dactylellina haptotyla (strain CBS 200.50) TaxID=1284197 RepID=S8AKK5_DACHA|nr:hypothetical protein H072_4434 [Dactylellina haptotyla CBS 200.50]